MIKRLSISLLLMGLAAFSLGAAAFAWFSDTGNGEVSISSGTLDLEFRIDIDCDGGSEDDFDTVWFDANTPFGFDWDNIVPGDSTTDCIQVRNNSANGTMTVFARHAGFGGNGALLNAVTFEYNAIGTGGVNCAATTANNAIYTAGRGCELDTIAPGDSFDLEVTAAFPDTGGNQNALSGLAFNFDTTLTGYTGTP